MTLYDGDTGGRPLSQVTLDGAILTDSLPNGALTTILLILDPGTVSSTIFAEVDLDSPAGRPCPRSTPINRLDITVALGPFSVSSVTLVVDSLSVDLDPTNLDVGGHRHQRNGPDSKRIPDPGTSRTRSAWKSS